MPFYNQSFVLVKTKNDNIFGGYATSAWQDTSDNGWYDYD